MVREFDERNLAKSRAVCAAMADAADTGKRALTERERQILDMWPRFEDGEAVWFGDSIDNDGAIKTVQGFKLYRSGPAFLSVVGVDHEKWLRIEDYKSLKRTAPKVFDADGVEIKVGDTVWTLDGLEGVVTKVEDGAAYIAYESDYAQCEEAENLTHVQPDSWQRLEEDAGEDPFRYCKTVGKRLDTFDNAEVFKSADIVRRAKKLAEVGE